MIEEILPAEVASAEAFHDPPDAVLFPEEEAVIAKAVDKRRREFTTARVCARGALAALGLPAVPVVPGERGAPQWPSGIVGSMTHCAGYRAAALGRDTEMTTIGIDAEPNEILPDGVLGTIALPQERAWLRTIDGAVPGVPGSRVSGSGVSGSGVSGSGVSGSGVSDSAVCWDRLLFCAKEAVYKAWFPLAKRWLGFEDAEIAVDRHGGFTAKLLVPGPSIGGRELTGFTGRWLVRGGFILAAISLAREDVRRATGASTRDITYGQ